MRGLIQLGSLIPTHGIGMISSSSLSQMLMIAVTEEITGLSRVRTRKALNFFGLTVCSIRSPGYHDVVRRDTLTSVV